MDFALNDDQVELKQAARAETQLKAAQADLAAIERGGNQEEVLNLDVQLTKARTDRDSAQRNLDALKKLQQEGAASAGEVREAENALARTDSQLAFLKQKQTKRYSNAEIAHVEAQRDAIDNVSRTVNRAAYARAHAQPAARAMWDEGFEQVMQAPVVQEAARKATSTGATSTTTMTSTTPAAQASGATS